MKAVIQRVVQASVKINGGETREISKGFVILLGVGNNDTSQTCQALADKILNLRVFPNDEGKFSKSPVDMNAEILIVSQFTLYGDCSKGRRPDFTAAARPEKAVPLYEEFIGRIKVSGLKTITGEFAADMLVDIKNDGPVTIIIDTETLPQKTNPT
jgi:D-tyrosyl-tRNA(Tyr) deacylase